MNKKHGISVFSIFNLSYSSKDLIDKLDHGRIFPMTSFFAYKGPMIGTMHSRQQFDRS